MDTIFGGDLSVATLILLFGALALALGFEFVNGFHDTANAVATVIYTRSLPANFARASSRAARSSPAVTASGVRP